MPACLVACPSARLAQASRISGALSWSAIKHSCHLKLTCAKADVHGHKLAATPVGRCCTEPVLGGMQLIQVGPASAPGNTPTSTYADASATGHQTAPGVEDTPVPLLNHRLQSPEGALLQPPAASQQVRAAGTKLGHGSFPGTMFGADVCCPCFGCEPGIQPESQQPAEPAACSSVCLLVGPGCLLKLIALAQQLHGRRHCIRHGTAPPVTSLPCVQHLSSR